MLRQLLFLVSRACGSKELKIGSFKTVSAFVSLVKFVYYRLEDHCPLLFK